MDALGYMVMRQVNGHIIETPEIPPPAESRHADAGGDVPAATSAAGMPRPPRPSFEERVNNLLNAESSETPSTERSGSSQDMPNDSDEVRGADWGRYEDYDSDEDVVRRENIDLIRMSPVVSSQEDNALEFQSGKYFPSQPEFDSPSVHDKGLSQGPDSSPLSTIITNKNVVTTQSLAWRCHQPAVSAQERLWEAGSAFSGTWW